MEAIEGQHFDVIVIGAGMSGLAAGIRLALFDKNVIILERHNAPGGLNSFYSIQGRKFDVGLHALTNFCHSYQKTAPLNKIFRQLRLSRDTFDLNEQSQSRIVFPERELVFSNDTELLRQEIAEKFPHQIDAFDSFIRAIVQVNAFDLNGTPESTRKQIKNYFMDPLLIEMLLLPVFCYGSAQQNDMDWFLFIVIFKSIFLEGLARPYEGIRQIIRVLLEKYRSLNGKRKMKCGVKRILIRENKAYGLELDSGEKITADKIISSIGLIETTLLYANAEAMHNQGLESKIGQISFIESIAIFKQQPQELGWNDTIVFFNDSEQFYYEKPQDFIDARCGVICMPNNYQYSNQRQLAEGVLRVTALANYDKWVNLPTDAYYSKKQEWYQKLICRALEYLPKLEGNQSFNEMTVFSDTFTPKTIKKFTGHLKGCVYGTPEKSRLGLTPIENLYICGTDQGYLGVTGALLSGITVANRYILQ